MSLALFSPPVRSWFAQTLGAPTPPQERAWPLLRSGADVLIAAPTGSGKTLAAFLAALDELATDAARGALRDEVRVVYVSPLKALSNDVHKNLLVPLAGIAARDESAAAIRAAVRTGDTTTKERAQHLKRPPHVLVTTPESLFLLLTSKSGRDMLATTRSVIVDEIHALAPNRRGAHLALSLERLAALTGRPLQRIGLSATQKPVETVARFLVGADAAGAPRPCAVVDVGHRRDLDVQVETPRSTLDAVMSKEVWDEVVDRLVAQVHAHRTTLVFVNTRRLAERLSLRLEERLGKDAVRAHHGSLSKERRFEAEQMLKEGRLACLVATASLELGIDIGSVDLVCLLGATKSIAAALQRVGRASHQVGGTSKGRLYPLSRDELVECAALVRAIKDGALDALVVPEQPLDVLQQQIVAMAADEEQDVAALASTVRRAWPYRALGDDALRGVLKLAGEGVQTERGRRGARVYFDEVNGKVRGRKGARIAALTSGGAIPDAGDYQVVEEPQGAFVGTINEDFAIESIPGDIFQLGNTSWRILKVEPGKVRVEDAKGLPPTIPFWLGEAPARTIELSREVARLREEVEALLAASDDLRPVVDLLVAQYGVDARAALQVAEYLAAARASLGCLPTTKKVVFERFYDELGGAQIVVHAPFGGRINRAWGLALRKRFCRSFDFELQAAATEDAILLSLGAMSGVHLPDVPRFLHPNTAKEVLVQAILQAPMFGTRFRWNASRALLMLRSRSGKRVPPGLQRIEAEDLLVAVFPQQVACPENIVGDREVPDHPLVQQTLDDCLREAMDVDGLLDVLRGIHDGSIETIVTDTLEPSPLAHEVIAAKPYAFLDDVPLEERRVQAIYVRRSLDQAARDDAGALDPAAIEEVLAQTRGEAATADEAHDALFTAGALPAAGADGHEGVAAFADDLVRDRRAAVVHPVDGAALLVATERLPLLRALHPTARVVGGAGGVVADFDRATALFELLKARLEATGPLPPAAIAAALSLPVDEVEATLLRLEGEGFALRGAFLPGAGAQVWSRRLVARTRRLMLGRLRAEIEPVSTQDYVRFLVDHQRVAADKRAQGREGLLNVLSQLDGVAAQAAAWEEEILPARVAGYTPTWLDQLCLSGDVAWARLSSPESAPAATRDAAARGARSLRTTPLSLFLRAHRGAWRHDVDDDADAPLSADARAVEAALAALGPSFFDDVVEESGLLPIRAEQGLAELVAAGRATSDSFAGLRALLLTGKQRARLERAARRRKVGPGLDGAGRWSLTRRRPVADPKKAPDLEELARTQARALLLRYGVVFRRVVEREPNALPWRELARALRVLEVQGEVRGGRFVQGYSGEQFALPEVVSALRAVRRREKTGALVVVAACDPLNLTGGVFPGARVPAVIGNRVLLQDGVAVAALEAGCVRMLDDVVDDAVTLERTSLLIGKRSRAALRLHA